jgi:hypothetical protein
VMVENKGNPSDPKNDQDSNILRGNISSDNPPVQKSKDVEGSKSDDMQQDTMDVLSELKVGQITLTSKLSSRVVSKNKKA